VRAVLWSFSTAVIGGGIVAAFVAFFLPASPEVVLDVYLLFLGAVALLALVRTLRVAQPGSGDSPFERALRPPRLREQRPPELVRLEQHLALSVTSAFDVHFRLRPAVRDVAGQRLWARHSIDLEADTERSEAKLGPAAWELVRPDRPPPPDPFGPGLNLQQIEQVVTELEGI
jgi:hypothetical protein